MGTLLEDIYKFIICCWIIIRMRNASDKSCRENQNIHFICSKYFSKLVLCMRLHEKYGRTRQTTDIIVLNRNDAICMLDN